MKKHSKYIIIVLLLICSNLYTAKAQVGINEPDPNKYAVLHAKENGDSKGILIPKMTADERKALQQNADLPEGLLIYDETFHRFFYYNAEAGEFWVLNPFNSATNSVAANEQWNYYLMNVNNVGIKTQNPTSTLSINGQLAIGESYAEQAQSTRVQDSLKNGAIIEGKVVIGNENTLNDTNRDIAEYLTVHGDSKVDGTSTANTFAGNGISPIGSIIMYHGYGDVPEGWATCNGNGTYIALDGQNHPIPDLRGAFIVGSGSGGAHSGGSNYELNSNGGSSSVVLENEQMPIHNHNATTGNAGSHSHDANHSCASDDGGKSNDNYYAMGDQKDGRACKLTIGDAGDHTHTVTVEDAGGDANGNVQAVENRPPYYALIYIIRIK